MTSKLCKKCREEKDISLFSTNGTSKKGTVVYAVNCKDCRAELTRTARTDSLTKICECCGVSWRVQSGGESKKTKNLCPSCYPLYRIAVNLDANARHRAKKRGLDYDLDVAFIHEKLKEGKCARTGVAFSVRYNGKSYRDRSPYTPSIDKIDPKKGYTKDNVQVVCWWYNFAKSTFSDQEVLELCKKLVNHASLST